MAETKLKGRKNIKNLELFRMSLFILIVIMIISLSYVVYLKSKNAISTETGVYDILKKTLTINSASETKINEIIYDSKDLIDLNVCKDYIFRTSKETIDIYDKSGRGIEKIPISMSNPLIETAYEYTAVGDIGGRDLIIFKKGKEVWKKSIKGNLISFNISSKGNLVYVDEAKSYRTAVNLVDSSGDDIFTSSKGDKFVVDGKISNSLGFLVANVIDTSGISTNTNIEFIDISFDFGKVLSSITKEDKLYTTIWPIDNSVISISNNEVSYFNSDGKEKWNKKINGQIQSSNILDNKYLVISTSNNINNIMDVSQSDILILNQSGKKIGEYHVKGNVRKIKTYKDMILVYTGREVFINNYKGKNIWKKSFQKDIKDGYFLYEDRLVLIDKDKIIILKISV